MDLGDVSSKVSEEIQSEISGSSSTTGSQIHPPHVQYWCFLCCVGYNDTAISKYQITDDNSGLTWVKHPLVTTAKTAITN